MSRISARFADLKKQNRSGFVAFISAGDPNYDTSLEILKGLPSAGADVIELDMNVDDALKYVISMGVVAPGDAQAASAGVVAAPPGA